MLVYHNNLAANSPSFDRLFTQESNALLRLHHTLQVSGQRFDDLDITNRRRLCEALYAAGRTKEAAESLLEMANAFDEEVYMSKLTIEWVSGEFMFDLLVCHACIRPSPSDFTQRCLWALESDGDAASKADQHDKAPTRCPTLYSPTHTLLLREWVRATLLSGSWKDALHVAVSVSIFLCTDTLRRPNILLLWSLQPRGS